MGSPRAFQRSETIKKVIPSVDDVIEDKNDEDTFVRQKTLVE